MEWWKCQRGLQVYLIERSENNCETNDSPFLKFILTRQYTSAISVSLSVSISTTNFEWPFQNNNSKIPTAPNDHATYKG